jgi:hypothetical protein
MGRKIIPNKKINTSLALEPKAIEIIDASRGQKSRSAYINEMVLERAGVVG